MSNAAKVIVAILLAALVIAAITFGGWEAGWWFKTQNANRETQLIRNSIGYQSNVQSEVDQMFVAIQQTEAQIQSPDVNGSEVSTLKASAYADLTQLCQYAAQANNGTLNQPQQQFTSINCENGAVSPSSPYSH